MAQDVSLTSPVAPGEVVADKYRVERVLGVGAMGVVVSARHTTLDQVVAIKFLVANGFGTAEESIARFLAEARASAGIDSDHVCRVFDVGTLPDGVPYMVMEHLVGNDLDEELARRGQLSVVQAVDYVLQAADAITAAHQRGIIHRDLKPANLFLAARPDGSRRVKVLDFGISKVGPGHSPGSARETGSVGTPAYMSPEQIKDPAHVDPRADIWALGALLYELVTGQMAFVGDDVKAVLQMVVSEDPCPMTALRRDVSPELEAIVMRCLQRDREKRWASAATFARALAPFGSVGIWTQLASVQKELGSSHSVRTVAAPSVEPMVANVRGAAVVTAPDLDELRARESIVHEWTKLRARKRVARTAVLGLAALTVVIAGVGMLAWRLSRTPGRAAAAVAPPQPTSELPEAPGNAPAPAAATAETIATTDAPIASASPAPSASAARAVPARATAPRVAPRAPKKDVNKLLDTRD